MTVLTFTLTAAFLFGGTGIDKNVVRGEMETVIASLDSENYAKAADAPEQIVLAYEWAQQRPPTPEEFHILLGLWHDLGLKSSEVLAFAIRGSRPEITWEMCAEFLARKSPAAQSSPRMKALAQDLMNTPVLPQLPKAAPSPPPARPPAKDAPGAAYNTYFGYLHAHSELSDGTGTPEEAYAGARDAGLDFFALTDHAELMRLWPWENDWGHARAAADAADEPGRFAALWGFEWSSPLYGHLNVINSQDYTDCLARFRLEDFYDWLVKRPEAFGRFNHPGSFDFTIFDLLHFRLFEHAVPQMVGVECWNGDDGFDVYHYAGNWTGPEPYIDLANLKGWRVGALGAEDNHRADWGRMGQFRTGVLATELTRDGIVDAYLNRRFYATEDGNLCLDFRCAGYPMGSVLDGGPRVFEVSAYDRDGETFEEVRLYRNGELIETRAVSGADVSESFEDASTAKAYYYVIVKQTDDSDANGRNDEAISSPIWFEQLEGVKFGCYSAGLEAEPASAGLGSLAVLALAAVILAVKAK